MGMDVSPESIPDHLVDVARKAWKDGDYQLALSLLYRGAIAWLIDREDIPIEGGDTEGDCLNRIQQLSNYQSVQYFADLTHAWITVAYGKQIPDDSDMQKLCDQYQ